MADFTLHPQLAKDSVPLAALGLCDLRLMNDATLPWLLLVPRRADLRELHTMPAEERALLMEEIALASRVLEAHCHPVKLNVGALGNLVPQLHVHVIARFTTDRAWPGPVWGVPGGKPYTVAELAETLTVLRKLLQAEGEVMQPA